MNRLNRALRSGVAAAVLAMLVRAVPCPAAPPLQGRICELPPLRWCLSALVLQQRDR
jgi:hypothetical protein